MADSFLVGRGISDVTGEPAGCGLLGYGKADQVSKGLHTRLRTRAFVFVDPATELRLLLCVSDLPLMFDSVHREVLRRLAAKFGELYNESNVMLTVTHTHCGPGGYSHHRLYNTTTHGFHPVTFEAIVSGIVEASERAHADVAPATVTLSHGVLEDASVNRSPQSFARNPEADKAFFPKGVDPQTTLLRVERDGRVVGAVDWFATHGTSMKNDNCLISADNKGYAAYHWERVVSGGDYLAGQLDFISAFAQTNAGDMSPNLNRAPGSGPTETDFENTRIIGQRQSDAAAALAAAGGDLLTGGIDYRMTYVDMGNVSVSPEFTGDGRSHRTTPVLGGAAALAGTDEGPGFWPFKQGRNRVVDAFSRHVVYRFSEQLRDSQAPKGAVLPGGRLNKLTPMVQERVPVQLLRIGKLYLIGIPGEVTITAGLRMRREVASVVGAELSDVLVAGYCNAYIHYVTTPEEYEEQRYEGGSTLFGKWEAPAFTQIAVELATAMRDGKAVKRGTPPPDLSAKHAKKKAKLRVDVPVAGRAFGDVLSAPRNRYAPGEQVEVAFAGANPNNNLHREGTYLEVEQRSGDSWRRVADDGDWATKLHWRKQDGGSRITITWDVPADVAPGEYRISYHGDASDAAGKLTPFTGMSPAFEVAR